MKTFLYFLLGLILGSVTSFAGLFLWARMFLEPNAGYWDRHDGAAESFFYFWIAFSVALGCAGAWIARRGNRTR
jgi:hypothetical protein